jgi:hypothetical protein
MTNLIGFGWSESLLVVLLPPRVSKFVMEHAGSSLVEHPYVDPPIFFLT